MKRLSCSALAALATFVAALCCVALVHAGSHDTTCPTGMPCVYDVDCNATLGCHHCSQWTNTCEGHPQCGSFCVVASDCAGVVGGCTECVMDTRMGGQCTKPSVCAKNCSSNFDCQRTDGNLCIECNTTAGHCQRPAPDGKCNSPCSSAADCGADSCTECAYGACINPKVPGQCGSTCTHQANCTGLCNTCVGQCMQLPNGGDKSKFLARYP